MSGWEALIGVRSEPVRNPVERGAVRRFAEAIGDPNPIFVEEAAARESRHGRPIAPPTFPITLDYGRVPGLRLPESGLIHGEQSFRYERPLFVGEEVVCWAVLRDATEKQARSGQITFLTFERVGDDPDGRRIFAMELVLLVTAAVRRGWEP